MRIEAKNPEDYISKLEEPRKGEIERLHKLVRAAAPSMTPVMDFGMIGYGKFHYRYKSGREGDWMLIGLASQKNYISLYVTCTKEGQYLAESYKPLLPKASIGKSCIRFKKLADVDIKVLEKLLKEAEKIGIPPDYTL